MYIYIVLYIFNIYNHSFETLCVEASLAPFNCQVLGFSSLLRLYHLFCSFTLCLLKRKVYALVIRITSISKMEGLGVCDCMGLGSEYHSEAAFRGQTHYFYVESMYLAAA